MGSMSLQHSVLNVKALVGAFNQENALVGALSVIVKTDCETDGLFYNTMCRITAAHLTRLVRRLSSGITLIRHRSSPATWARASL